MIKVAHLAVVTPRRCGLYETTRELVMGLRELGVDSRIVDPDTQSNPIKWSGTEDRGIPVSQIEWVNEADIVVSHSGLGKLENINKPIIHVAHGRPRHSFLSEANGGTPIYSYHYNNNYKQNLKAVVTFWEQHKPYLDVMYPDKPVYYVSSPVDLDYWKPGQSNYDFGGKAGDVNFVCADAFRDDIDCYDPINAFALYARNNKGCKIHVFGKPKNMKGWGALLKRIEMDGNLGLVQGWAANLEHVYRKADCVLTAHEINVRTVREAMACGCPVAKVNNLMTSSRSIRAALTTSREEARRIATELFDLKNTAKQFIEILNNAVH